MHYDPDVEDDDLLPRVVYGVYTSIIPHADPVEMLLPPPNLRTPNGTGVSERASILWSMRGTTSRQCRDVSLDACLTRIVYPAINARIAS